MSLPNQVVYIQFHPVAYMVKLNIEMSMADLITRLARCENADTYLPSTSQIRMTAGQVGGAGQYKYAMQSVNRSSNAVSEDSSSGGLGAVSTTGGLGKLTPEIQVETVITSRTSPRC